MLRLLKPHYEVQIIGFDGSGRIYEPLADVAEYQKVERIHTTGIVRASRLSAKLDRMITGDAVICIKPLMQSYGMALLAARHTPRPLILDIDDWEIGFLSSSPYWEMRGRGLRWFSALDSPLYTRLLNGFTYKAAALTVSNSFLQGVYGGHWIPHVKEDAVSDPGTINEPKAAAQVLFAGAPRGHKGLPTLVAAWKLVKDRTAELHLAVPDTADEMLGNLQVGQQARVRITGPYRFSDSATDRFRGLRRGRTSRQRPWLGRPIADETHRCHGSRPTHHCNGCRRCGTLAAGRGRYCRPTGHSACARRSH